MKKILILISSLYFASVKSDSTAQISLESIKTSELDRIENRQKTKTILGKLLREIITEEKNDPYIHAKAKVRCSTELPSQEVEFLKERDVYTLTALEKFLKIKIKPETAPRIALCFSGGGYRSMIGTLGALICAKKEGLLDTVSYISCLSGSTWAIAPWTTTNFSLKTLETVFRRRLSESIDTFFGIGSLIKNCFWKVLYNQPLSLVDVWGLLLGKKLLNFSCCSPEYDMTGRIPRLSDSINMIKKKNLPMPIYTSIMANRNHEWTEFTPYEVGSYTSKCFVPSWAFGRSFYDGISINNAPEAGLDYYLGVWSSAFSANLEEILKIYGSFSAINILEFLKYTYLSKIRLTAAKICNICYGLQNHPWNYLKHQILVDAGIDFNLPLPPLLRKERKIDIIIIFDMSSTIHEAQELQHAQNYALKNNFRFPKINYVNIDKKIISVFKDEFPAKPVIIYMPRIQNKKYSSTFDPTEVIKNRGYCSTFNFKYTTEQFDELSGLIKFNLQESLETIKKTILDVINIKKIQSTSQNKTGNIRINSCNKFICY